MKCIATFSENNLYKIKLTKTHLRLRLRFTEAIKEAQEICEDNIESQECHWAWYEVDELEDSLMRQ